MASQYPPPTSTVPAPPPPQFSPALTNIDTTQYEPQLQAKVSKIKAQFSHFDPPDLEIFKSAPSHYRMRSEFGVWHQGTDMYYVMHEPTHTDTDKSEGQGQGNVNKNNAKDHDDDAAIKLTTASKFPPKPKKVRVDQFPVASKLINELMSILRQHVMSTEILKKKLFQVNFHTTLSGNAMVTMVYHRKLDDAWKKAAEELRIKLSTAEHCRGASAAANSGAASDSIDEETPTSKPCVHVIGRSRKQKICLDEAEVEETLVVSAASVDQKKTYTYMQVEGAFSQPNGGVCQHMLSWAQSVTAPPRITTTIAVGDSNNNGGNDEHKHDLLELYCGNGNFTIALAENFRKVVATEISKTSVAAAHKNITLNSVDNIFVARMSSEEFTEAWKTGKQMNRLKDLDFSTLKLKTLLVDPPRAGLDDQTLQLLTRFDNVVYISCNPETLHANLEAVKDVFEIKSFAVFDQFPYTHHIEVGAYLQKKKNDNGKGEGEGEGRGVKRPASDDGTNE